VASVEVRLARKHTAFIERDLTGLVAKAVGRLNEQRDRQERRLVAYKATEFDDKEAYDLLIRALDARALPVTRIPVAPIALPSAAGRFDPRAAGRKRQTKPPPRRPGCGPPCRTLPRTGGQGQFGPRRRVRAGRQDQPPSTTYAKAKVMA
jgi:hypothetical protein